jgi:hypothetical protein
MKPPKVLDNKKYRVVDELKVELNKGSKLSVISAYFTIYAYAELKKELSKIDNMRFIFTEPTFVHKDQELIREYYIVRNPEKKMSGNEFEIKLRNEMKQAAIAKECAQWLEKKAEIKSLRQANPAQPRLVYIENHEDNVSINGTVDFTSDGLGITPSNRLDSNMCLYGKDYTISFLQAFNELWEDDTAVQDVKDKVLEQMRILYKENTPEFIYFVTLYNIFNNYLDELTEDNIVKSRTGFKETFIWNKLYKFQKDGVMGAIDKIEKYNGCIIADSVGLGKTFTALAVIKYYELRNDRVLVIVPKKLRENWTVYTMNDKRNIFSADRFNYDVLNHTDLSRTSGYSGEINLATLNWSNYRFKPLILEFSPLFSCFHRITVNPNSLSGCYLITPTWPASLDSPWIRLHKGTGEGDGRRYQWFSCPSLPWNFTTAVKAKPLTRLPAMSSAKWLT